MRSIGPKPSARPMDRAKPERGRFTASCGSFFAPDRFRRSDIMRRAGPYANPDAGIGILTCPCAAYEPNEHHLSLEAIMTKNLLASILLALTVTAAVAQAPTKDALVARAKSFELDTSYVPPPGDPLTHHAAGFAKVMCSAVFLTGLTPDSRRKMSGFSRRPTPSARSSA